MGDDVIAKRGPAGRGTGDNRYPLTASQAEKWLGSQYSGQAALAFGEAFELAFDGDLDVDALSSAFAAVVARHEVLSMRFEPDGSAQCLEPPTRVALQHVVMHGTVDADAAYLAFAEARTSEAFDLESGPLVRAWLCSLGAHRWRLLIQTHHLVCDGWSLRVFVADVTAHYNQAIGKSAARIPPVDSWVAYVEAERQRRCGTHGRRSLGYWLEAYRDLPEPLQLPTDAARGATLDFAAGTVETEAPDGLWRDARARARELGVTRFSLLLAAYFRLLHRLTGQDDLVCGIPVAGAAQGAGWRVLGDTDNTLPLRIRIVAAESSVAFVQRVHRKLREALDHQDVSLGQIVDALPLRREPGRLMLVECLLTLNPAIDRLRFEGVEATIRVMPRRATAWELSFQWRPMPGRTILEIQFHSSLYRESTIRGWCDAYFGLLRGLIDESHVAGADSNPDRGIALAARGSSLVDVAIRDWNIADALPELLTAAFARFGGRRAAHCAGRDISYSDLDKRSAECARALIALGVVPGQLVGLCMERSLDMLVAVLGVLRSGAAYVPLDPAFPIERLQFMVRHAALGLVVTSGDHVALAVDDVQCRLVEFQALIHHEKNTSERDRQHLLPTALPAVDADSLAYVLYTSGSTGEPKGVRILHRNLVNFLRSMHERPGFSESDILCSATTLSFDIAALELFLPLICGGCVVIADGDEHRDPEALARLIERTGCTVLQTTPSLLALLREVGRGTVLKGLRLLVGGEAFPPALANALLPVSREVWNMYGPTETTVWSSAARLEGQVSDVPLGTPIANTRIHVLDAQGRPSLPGALGEIWLGGAGVADGYLHRDDLTSARFVDDPFAKDGSKMYRTGDLGRIRGGQLYFNGRADEQIKLRGYRIEPGEIEAAAAEEPGIVDCVAVARPADNGDLLLVLYVASSADSAALTVRTRERLARALPPYMRPQHIVVLDSLPKTPNGKIDRRALPAPDTVVTPYAATAPRDAIEHWMCALWQRLLDHPCVGIHDDFFSMGGYSLLAVRMFAEINGRYGVELPLSVLIERPTVASLSDALREAGVHSTKQKAKRARSWASSKGVPASIVELRAGDRGPPLFMLHAIGGHVLNYRSVAQTVPQGMPVFGVQSVGLDGGESPLRSIDAMAERYAHDIRTLCPDGPYLLAGGSMGGLLALEVARRLGAAASRASVWMFDTYGPAMEHPLGESPWRPHRWWALYRALDADQRRWVHGRIAFRLWRLPTMQLRRWASRGRSVPQALRIHDIERANYAALMDYRPQPYRGDIVLFTAQQSKVRGDRTLGWSGSVDAVEVIELPGRHDNVMEQPELAARFGESVRACVGASRDVDGHAESSLCQ